MKNHVAVARRDAQFTANLGRFEFEKLPHHEHAGSVFRQMFEASLEYHPELLLPQGFLRVAPIRGSRTQIPVRIGLELRFEGLIEAFFF